MSNKLPEAVLQVMKSGTHNGTRLAFLWPCYLRLFSMNGLRELTASGTRLFEALKRFDHSSIQYPRGGGLVMSLSGVKYSAWDSKLCHRDELETFYKA